MGLDSRAVLDAAGTKLNIHPFHPGLVGGHCIPGNPYYLVMKVGELGYHPQVILAGRAIKESLMLIMGHLLHREKKLRVFCGVLNA